MLSAKSALDAELRTFVKERFARDWRDVTDVTFRARFASS
jgi:hypothetical protein